MHPIHWKRFVPFVFYAVVAIALGSAATLAGSLPLAAAALLVVAGFLCWQPVEYCLHRFAFHFDAKSERGRKFVYDHHLVHHENPKDVDDIFANLTTSLPLASLFFALAWGLSGSWRVASFLSIGLIAGYFAYEWLHYQAHHRAPKLRVLQYLKKYHMLHHHKSPELRFGVTSPALDWLFGTWGPVGRASRKS